MGPEGFCLGSVCDNSRSALADPMLDLNVNLLDYLYGAFLGASAKTTDSDSTHR